MELITAGITCYNARESVEGALRSAQEQTWPSLEIVVVDDHSTDDSWDIVERMAVGDGRIRAVRHAKNGGVGAARNTVLKNASGAFVAFFDDDDISRPERLALQRRRIVDYERATGADLVVCCSATEQAFPGDETRYSPTLGMDMTPAPSSEEVARLILLGRPVTGGTGPFPTSSQMARREVYEGVDGFDERLRRHEDTDINLRFALAGAHFAGVSAPLVVQTVTFTRDKAVGEDRRYALYIIEKHRDLLERWGYYEFTRRWTEMKYAVLSGRAMSALPHLTRLLLVSPLKLARKAAWTLPNRQHYKRYAYPHE